MLLILLPLAPLSVSHLPTGSQHCAALFGLNCFTPLCVRCSCSQGHTDGLNAAAISPDETWIATASYDGTARVWAMQTGECRHVLDTAAPVNQVGGDGKV